MKNAMIQPAVTCTSSAASYTQHVSLCFICTVSPYDRSQPWLLLERACPSFDSASINPMAPPQTPSRPSSSLRLTMFSIFFFNKIFVVKVLRQHYLCCMDFVIHTTHNIIFHCNIIHVAKVDSQYHLCCKKKV